MASSQALESRSRSSRQSGARLGFWTAILLTVVTAAVFALGITTPPRSGPFCTDSCIAYPFTDAARFVPRDYFWVWPGMLAVPLFMIVACCLTNFIEPRKRHLGLIAVCFAAMSAAIIGTDYFIQFQVIEPSLVRGETIGLGLFTLYNPHGFYIALENLGYLLLSTAFLFAGLAFPPARAIGGAIRWTFLVSFVLAILTFVGMTWRFGLEIEYRFEVAIITIVWTTLMVLGILLGIYFRKAEAPEKAG